MQADTRQAFRSPGPEKVLGAFQGAAAGHRPMEASVWQQSSPGLGVHTVCREGRWGRGSEQGRGEGATKSQALGSQTAGSQQQFKTSHSSEKAAGGRAVGGRVVGGSGPRLMPPRWLAALHY